MREGKKKREYKCNPAKGGEDTLKIIKGREGVGKSRENMEVTDTG